MNSRFSLTNGSTSQALSIALLAIMVVFALGLNYYTTAQGVGASPDSAVYIGVAKNLISGAGLRIPFGDTANTPLTQFPPFYSLVLAMIGFFTNRMEDALRILNLVLLAGNLVVYWLFARRITHPFYGLASVLLAPLAAGIGFLTIHIMAWSEGLFLFLGFGGLYLIATAPSEQLNQRILLGGVLLSLSSLTRYAGIAFVLSAALYILFLPGTDPFGRRLQKSVGVSVVGLLLPVTWLVYNQVSFGNAINRALSFHPIKISTIVTAIQTIANWIFLPTTWQTWLKGGILLFLIIIAGASLYNLARQSRDSNGKIARILIIFLFVYALFLAFSLTFVDANTPLDDRLLSPAFFSVWLLFGYLIYGYRHLLRSKLPLIASIALVVYPFLSLNSTSTIIQNAHQNGIGFFSKTWQQSETIGWIKQNAVGLTLYSNAPEGIFLNTGVSALALPKKNDLMKNQPNPQYSQQMSHIGNRLSSGEVAVVYFTFITSLNLPTLDELDAVANFTHKTSLRDSVLILPNPTP